MRRYDRHSCQERDMLLTVIRLLICRAPNGDGTFCKCAPNDEHLDLAESVLAESGFKQTLSECHATVALAEGRA